MHPKIMEIRAELLNLLSLVENYEEKEDFSLIPNMIEKIKIKREKLIKALPANILKKNSKYFTTLTKQIQKNIDDIIKKNRSEQETIVSELKLLKNKKKLSKYNR
ncbi:MAG: hypothetical protein KAQ90_01005 [Melioribacteraceae bacterium]|nr:hypothetical protein [Melioribacteraceae bacterium]